MLRFTVKLLEQLANVWMVDSTKVLYPLFDEIEILIACRTHVYFPISGQTVKF